MRYKTMILELLQHRLDLDQRPHGPEASGKPRRKAPKPLCTPYLDSGENGRAVSRLSLSTS
jgi:hypothetical protein